MADQKYIYFVWEIYSKKQALQQIETNGSAFFTSFFFLRSCRIRFGWLKLRTLLNYVHAQFPSVFVCITYLIDFFTFLTYEWPSQIPSIVHESIPAPTPPFRLTPTPTPTLAFSFLLSFLSWLSLPCRRSYGFVTQSFLSWDRNAWWAPKNVCVGG